MSLSLVLLGVVFAAASGVPGLFLARNSTVGQQISTALAIFGSGLGLVGVGWYWATGESAPIVLPWQVPGAEFSVAIDGLSALFLMPIFLISMLGGTYGLSYWRQTEHPQNGPKLRLFYGLLTAGMGLLVLARNSVLFLVAWEVMALSGFFLVTTEDGKEEVRAIGWIYLVATHIATLCLFAMFALLRTASDSFTLAPLEAGILMPNTATMVFALALVGFGIKAGIMPLHVWLPGAHAIAPSHVSAIFSGVIIKMGIYGLVRMTSLLPNPPVEWGAVVLAFGAVSGVLGVAFAIGQHDLKRLLAYHSIENIGIIVMGLGLALMGRSLGRTDWVILGLSGALLHVWNHALFKALLFFSAGSVIHSVHTREIDHLGGLAKRMPRTALCFLIGAVAICGLPPLNGFVSELLIYLGLFHTLGDRGGWSLAGASFAAPTLALIGALAVACFVKVYGAVFLGAARSQHAAEGHESPRTMVGPMFVLAGCCFFIGLAPALIAPILDNAARAWDSSLVDAPLSLTALAPLGWVTGMSLLLVAILLVSAALLWSRLRHSIVERTATWGCGYVAPTSRMQYTSSSFAQMLVGLFGWALRPRIRRPENLPMFPRKSDFHSEAPDVVLDEAVLPAFRFGEWLFSLARVLQRGSVQLYLLYIFIALIALLLWR
jgi:hydrogenase-4 component B